VKLVGGVTTEFNAKIRQSPEYLMIRMMMMMMIRNKGTVKIS